MNFNVNTEANELKLPYIHTSAYSLILSLQLNYFNIKNLQWRICIYIYMSSICMSLINIYPIFIQIQYLLHCSEMSNEYQLTHETCSICHVNKTERWELHVIVSLGKSLLTFVNEICPFKKLSHKQHLQYVKCNKALGNPQEQKIEYGTMPFQMIFSKVNCHSNQHSH